MWFPIYFTVFVATLATLLNLAIALPLAYRFANHKFPFKNFLDALLTQPLVIPPTVLGYYLLVTFGRSGFLGRALESIGVDVVFTWRGAVMAAMVSSFPLVFRPLKESFESIDTALKETSRIECQSAWQRFYYAELPLVRNGLVSATLLGFARCTGDFGTTLMVAGNIPNQTQTLSMKIYDNVQSGDVSEANLLVLLLTGFAITVILVVNRTAKRPVD